MSGNLENDRSITTGKMYPIDLAPQKITIVKSVSNTEVKMAHLLPGQPKTSAASQLLTHAAPLGLMRPTAQILSPGVSSQPQMIMTGSPLLQGTPIATQGSQIIGQSSQVVAQSQIISPTGQILSPGTQIISQGTQLTSVSSSNNTGSSNAQVSVPSSVSGQVLSVGGLVNAGPLVSGAANLVVSSSVRTLPPSVRVLPPLPHHSRPAASMLPTVNVSTNSGVLVSKGVTSHVPRGLAAGASLAVRPVAPTAASSALSSAWSSGNRGRSAVVYGSRTPTPRPARTPAAPVTPATGPTSTPAVTMTQAPHSAVVTLPTTTVLNSTGVIPGSLRAVTPFHRATTPSPRPLPLLQRNYQPKVVGVASVGVRGVIGNSAPAQVYYEVPRAQPTTQHTPLSTQHTPLSTQHTQLSTQHTPHSTQHTPQHSQLSSQHTPQLSSQLSLATHTSLGTQHTPQHTPHVQLSVHGMQSGNVAHHAQSGNVAHHAQSGNIAHGQSGNVAHHGQSGNVAHHGQSGNVAPASLTHQHQRPLVTPYALSQNTQVNSVSAVQALSEVRPLPAVSITSTPVVPRPTILRKRDADGSPTKTPVSLTSYRPGSMTWEDVPAGGGDRSGSGGSTTISASSSPAPEDDPDLPRIDEDVSPRKRPRKQMLTNEVRQSQEFRKEESPPTPPVVDIKPPKRPLLSSSYVCGWRSTALHFTRPADVKRREPRAKDILQIASQKHVLTSAEGWKVHHLTAQMDDLVSLEADVGAQLSSLLKSLEAMGARVHSQMQPHSHNVLELLKGNIQRSKIVCEGIQEAREDILRVFTHRNFVADILQRQADKRCFRKHRSQS